MTSFIASPQNAPAVFSGSAKGRTVSQHVGASSTVLTVVGSASPIIARTHTVQSLPMLFEVSGSAKPLTKIPAGALRDFSHFTTVMDDPAKVLVVGKAAGLATYDSGQPSGMRRVWATIAPPQDYPVSGGKFAWRRAAFASNGVRVNQLPVGATQYIDGAQYEITPKAQTGPTAYAPARSLQIKVNPDRLNFCTNPSFAVDTTGWSTSGGVTLTTTSAHATHGSVSGLATWATSGAYAQSVRHTVTGLIVGKQYTFAADVYVPVGMPRVVLDVTGASGSPVSSPTSAPHWQRLSVTFTASAGTATVRAVCYDAATAGQVAYIDGVVVEPGAVAGPYFDGAMGGDYLWEAGGSANNSRSYYYRDRDARAYLLGLLLQENCPLGVIPSTPQYAVLPTQ